MASSFDPYENVGTFLPWWWEDRVNIGSRTWFWVGMPSIRVHAPVGKDNDLSKSVLKFGKVRFEILTF